VNDLSILLSAVSSQAGHLSGGRATRGNLNDISRRKCFVRLLAFSSASFLSDIVSLTRRHLCPHASVYRESSKFTTSSNKSCFVGNHAETLAVKLWRQKTKRAANDESRHCEAGVITT